MSGLAWHRLLVDGPDDRDLLLFLGVAADFDTGSGEFALSLQAIAPRARQTYYRTRLLLGVALAAGWLQVVEPSRSGAMGVYKWGPALANTSRISRGPRDFTPRDRGQTSRFQATKRRKTSLDVKAPGPGSAEGSGAHLEGGAAPPGARGDIPPAPAGPVDNPHEIVAEAQEYLQRIRRRSPHHPDHEADS